MNKIVQKRTRNYSLFEMNEFNRATSSDGKANRRRDLEESMRRDGYWKIAPIACVRASDGKYRIIDGHNRYITARELGIPVEYIVYSTDCKVNPLKFSTTQKSWNLSQITEAYAKDGYEDYAEVREFHMDTGIPLGLCFSMFYGEVASSNNAKKHIRSGGYRVKDRKHPYKVARIALSANSYCDFALKTNFIIALSKCITVAAFDEKRIVRNFEKHGALLAPCRSADEYIVLLEKIYNYAAKGERLYLVVEVDKAMRQRKVGK